jgi:hypothetical protein
LGSEFHIVGRIVCPEDLNLLNATEIVVGNRILSGLGNCQEIGARASVYGEHSQLGDLERFIACTANNSPDAGCLGIVSESGRRSIQGKDFNPGDHFEGISNCTAENLKGVRGSTANHRGDGENRSVQNKIRRSPGAAGKIISEGCRVLTTIQC